MKRKICNKILFELSYFSTVVLFAMKEHFVSWWFSWRLEAIWERAIMGCSDYLRK